MGTWTVLKWGLRSWYDEMVMFVLVGMAAFVTQLPFAFVVFIAIGLPPELLLLCLPFLIPFVPSPALVGLHTLGRELARGEGVSWSLFWRTTRRYFWRSLAIYAISLVATILLSISMRFYLSSDNTVLQWIGFGWLYVFLIWLIMHLYLLPLMLEQERRNLPRLYRNAFIVVAAKPLLSVFLLLASLLLVILGVITVIGLPVVVVPLIVVLADHALQFAVYGPPVRPE